MTFPDSDSDTSRARTNKAIWAIIAVMLIAVCVSYSLAGLSIEIKTGAQILAVIPTSLGIAWYYRYRRFDPWISNGAEATAQLIAVVVLGTLLSYSAAAANFPYRDPELYAIDQWLGFDWKAYLDFINRHPMLGYVSNAAYFSMKLQLPLLILTLVVRAEFSRLQSFVIATALSLAITLIVFTFVPAIAYYAYLDVRPEDFANLSPSTPYEHIRHLEGIRTGATHIVSLDDLEGLITFPSFHTTSAILYVWAFWPARNLRWWIVGLNVLMIASTPIDGAHYAIDLIGGAFVAVVGIVGALWAQRSLNDIAQHSEATGSALTTPPTLR